MALWGFLLRVVMALLMVVVMTLIVYPLFALWTFAFLVRVDQGHRCIFQVFQNAMWGAKVTVRISRDK